MKHLTKLFGLVLAILGCYALRAAITARDPVELVFLLVIAVLCFLLGHEIFTYPWGGLSPFESARRNNPWLKEFDERG